MQYHPVTFHGPSQASYSHSNKHPIYGSGQDSGNAGAEWNFLSVALMALIDKHSQGCEIEGPTKNK